MKSVLDDLYSFVPPFSMICRKLLKFVVFLGIIFEDEYIKVEGDEKMAIKNSTIHFYELKYLELANKTDEAGNQIKKNLGISVFKQTLISILNANLNEFNTMPLNDGECILEVKEYGKFYNGESYSIKDSNGKNKIENDAKWIFGKMGKKRELVNFQLRDLNTFEPEIISKQIDQFFECYSCFYMFFEGNDEKCIIAFLMAQSAPKVKDLSYIRDYIHNDYIVDINPIVMEDALKMIMSKDIINSIKYSVALPSDDILSKIFMPEYRNQHEDEFDKLFDANVLELELVLKGGRGRNLVKDKNAIKNIVEKLKSHANNGHAKNLKVCANAKNENEKMMEYNFIESKFISKVVFNIENAEGWEDEVRRTMKLHYGEKRNEILSTLR